VKFENLKKYIMLKYLVGNLVYKIQKQIKFVVNGKGIKVFNN